MSRSARFKKSLLQRVCDSSAAKLLCLISAIFGLLPLGSVPHEQVGTNIEGLAPKVSAPIKSIIASLPGPTLPASTQSSFGAQSPNVNGVQHSVRIRYIMPGMGVSEGSTEQAPAASPVLSGRTHSTIQTSHGPQSPNVSDVRGSVDIRYGSATVASEGQSSETK
jgi:hypothetical protein